MTKTIEGWEYSKEYDLAYLIENNVVKFEEVVEYNNSELALLEGEASADVATINSDGTIVFDDFLDLRQFNVCHNLLNMIHLLNLAVEQVTGKKYLYDFENEMKKVNEIKITKKSFDSYDKHFKNYDAMDIFIMGQENYEKLLKKESEKPISFDEIEGIFTFKGNSYSIKQQFIKYVFVDNKIVSRKWAIEDLYSYYFSMSKTIYDLEKEANQKNFLNISDEVIKYLKK